MHSHQHLLSGGACLHLVARPAHHDRHFLKTEPAPFTLSYYCLPFEALDRGPKPPLISAPTGTGPRMPMWVCGFGGWCFLVWPGRKTRHAARVLPRFPVAAPPSKTPPKSRCWWECISPELAAEGGHRPGQLLSGIRRTDAFPANPGWGLAQERPGNWSTALSGTGTTGPTPRRGSISKISPPRSAPIVHLCQQLLSVDTEITMSAHDRRPPPARPLHHP